MEYDKESDDKMHSCPEHCHRCVDACPTKALCEDYTMNWRFRLYYFHCAR